MALQTMSTPLLHAPTSRRPSYTEPEPGNVPMATSHPAAASHHMPSTIVYIPHFTDVSTDTATSLSASSFWHSSTAWLIYYFLANLSLTLHNKALLNKFPFPWTLTAVHALCGYIGANIACHQGYFERTTIASRDSLVLLAFSGVYTINIAVSNLSLNLVTVPVSPPQEASLNRSISLWLVLACLLDSSIKSFELQRPSSSSY